MMISNGVHRIILSTLFSIVQWLIINFLWVEMSFFKYMIIEIFIIICLKLFNFTCSKTGINYITKKEVNG
jgi:accessory gene regulator protein AgrB